MGIARSRLIESKGAGIFPFVVEMREWAPNGRKSDRKVTVGRGRGGPSIPDPEILGPITPLEKFSAMGENLYLSHSSFYAN